VLPPLDFAVFDGGFVHLGTAARNEALTRIARTVKPGGILLLGYHALPGFAAMMPLRDVLNSVTATQTDVPITRLRAALDWLAMADHSTIGFLSDHPGLRRRLNNYADIPEDIAATELFSPTLTPFHFAQVNASAAAHGFTFAGNAALHLNMLDLAVPSAVRAILKRARSRIEFETLRDVLRNPCYRIDVYVRGAAIKNATTFWQQHDSLLVGLTHDADRVDFGGTIADLSGFPFEALREALANGPRRVSDIPDLGPEIARDTVRSALAAEIIAPFAREATQTPSPQGDAIRVPLSINRALLADALNHPKDVPLVSPLTGTAWPIDPAVALVLSAITETGCGFAEAEATVQTRLLSIANGRGQTPEGQAALTALVRRGLDGLTPECLATWARLGIVTGG
ncbi:MAG: methyltransferase regulatory domain-containing protein, partial [Rhodospirillaceae bacterium]|nr:methyltransferase regulatory domain-containing protein [Rhodospirillaceae bacterium]